MMMSDEMTLEDFDSGWEGEVMSDQCKHGSLLRSCEICERDVEIERLRAEAAEKDKRIEELEAARRALGGEEKYPCVDCGVLRTKAEGGTTFTVCDECWDKRRALDGEE